MEARQGGSSQTSVAQKRPLTAELQKIHDLRNRSGKWRELMRHCPLRIADCDAEMRALIAGLDFGRQSEAFLFARFNPRKYFASQFMRFGPVTVRNLGTVPNAQFSEWPLGFTASREFERVVDTSKGPTDVYTLAVSEASGAPHFSVHCDGAVFEGDSASAAWAQVLRLAKSVEQPNARAFFGLTNTKVAKLIAALDRGK